MDALTTVNGEDGQSLSVVGDTYRIVVSGAQTGGAYSVVDMLIPKDGGPGPHAHPATQEAFYVVDGAVEVNTRGETYTARAGSFVNIPLNGPPHDFKNVSDKTAHLLCILTPAGMETLFQEMGVPVAFGTFLPPPDMTDPDVQKRFAEIAQRHGQQLFPPDYLEAKP